MIVKCGQCGKANRIPPLESGKAAVCGNCKAPLQARPGPVTLTDSSFASAIASGASVVDFWAGWCGPCHMMAPVIDQLAAERTDVRFAKVNVDDNPRTAS